jgi:RING-variant domain
MIYSRRNPDRRYIVSKLRSLTPRYKKLSFFQSPILNSLKKIPKSTPPKLLVRYPSDFKLEPYLLPTKKRPNHSRNEFKHLPSISKFEIPEESNIQTEKNISNRIQPTCRICLDTDNPHDLISPCLCKGHQKHVHQSCLKTWILITEKYETEISACEVCRFRFCMEFQYSNSFSPCNQESCRAWIYFLFSFIMIVATFSLYLQGFVGNNPSGVAFGVVSMIFIAVGMFFFVNGLIRASRVCFVRKLSDWSILNY